MKYDLAGNLANDLGGLGGLHNVLSHVGCEPWFSRGSRPPPQWRSAERNLVATIVSRAATHKVLAAPLECTGLGSFPFHAHQVRSALANREASRSCPGGDNFWGAAPKMAFCHGTQFKY